MPKNNEYYFTMNTKKLEEGLVSMSNEEFRLI